MSSRWWLLSRVTKSAFAVPACGCCEGGATGLRWNHQRRGPCGSWMAARTKPWMSDTMGPRTFTE